MTANPDSALRQALVAAEKLLVKAKPWIPPGAHPYRPQAIALHEEIDAALALIIEALQRGEK